MNKRIFSIFVFVCAAAVFISAQTKQVTSREFYGAASDAQKLMSERSTRMVTKTDNLENGAIVETGTKIYERLLPDRERVLVTEKIGDKETSSEYIRIGYMEYRRKDNEAWTAKDLRTDGGSGTGSGSGSGSACIQYTEETTVVDGAPAKKLRQFIIGNTPKGLSFDDMISWFDQTSGLFIKSERTKGLLDPRVEKTRSATTYEYEPNIKIEAPIKDAPNK